MNYQQYREKMSIGTELGSGARAYRIERITEENTYLRGKIEAMRQGNEAAQGPLRIMPTMLILDVMAALEAGRISLAEIRRDRSRGNSQSTSIFNRLGLDYDPFMLGYDSNIQTICAFLSSGAPGGPAPTKQTAGYLPKPFLLLAGISGTGKTRWVRDREIEGEGNVEIIPVRPDWHEPSDLLGYVSRISGTAVFVPTAFLAFLVRAWRNAWKVDSSLNASAAALAKMLPFWLCLDEMNLAPVEQYFADYLSVLELREWSEGGLYSCPPLLRIEAELAETVRGALGMDAADPLWLAFADAGGIPLPPNLVVVGTVNMDETAHAFSRKVLDRALTVEFDAVDFGLFGGSPIEGRGTQGVPWDGISSVTDSNHLIDLDQGIRSAVMGLLEAWNAILAQTPFRIAYRTINEALLIAGSLPLAAVGEILDWVAMTKLLPRLEGDEDRLGLDRDGGELSYLEQLAADWQTRFGEAWAGSRSRTKLDFMSLRLKRSGYSSFWP